MTSHKGGVVSHKRYYPNYGKRVYGQVVDVCIGKLYMITNKGVQETNGRRHAYGN
jgi:hypothetical protein